jgi:glycosyltransferase involved in cell wall biosynthesis
MNPRSTATAERQHSIMAANSSPTRVAAMIFTLDVSGPGRQLVALGQELQRRGVAFTILLLRRPGLETTFPAFAAAAGIECRLIDDRGPFDPVQLREIRAFIADWKPGLIETHGYKPTSIMYLLRRSGVKVPWVGFFEGQTDKGLKDRLYHRLDLFMLRSAGRAVVMSALQRAMLPKRATHVRVVANAVPELARAGDGTSLPAILRRKRGQGPVPHIGVIGRLSREKGVDVFLDALARMIRNGRDAHAVIIGEGPLEAELKQQAGRLGLTAHTHFTGRIDIVREVYEALDLMVIPSRSEGLPSVLLEALPADLPVVSTRVGAMIEIAAAEPHAMWLVPPDAPGQLAASMSHALDSSEVPEARLARARVAESYSIGRRADHMQEIFAEAVAARGAP